jgi:hypothetical protein
MNCVYFFVAKSYALVGDAEHAAHYLKLSTARLPR